MILVDMLPSNMLEKASVGILSVPDFPDVFDKEEIARLESAKADFSFDKLGQMSVVRTSDRSVHERPSDYIESTDEIRANLHGLAKFMSGEILYEAVDVLKSVELLDVPEVLTPEEWANVLAGREEIELGETSFLGGSQGGNVQGEPMYELRFARRARRYLQRVDSKTARRLNSQFAAIKADPVTPGISEPLRGFPGIRSTRVGPSQSCVLGGREQPVNEG